MEKDNHHGVSRISCEVDVIAHMSPVCIFLVHQLFHPAFDYFFLSSSSSLSISRMSYVFRLIMFWYSTFEYFFPLFLRNFCEQVVNTKQEFMVWFLLPPSQKSPLLISLRACMEWIRFFYFLLLSYTANVRDGENWRIYIILTHTLLWLSYLIGFSLLFFEVSLSLFLSLLLPFFLFLFKSSFDFASSTPDFCLWTVAFVLTTFATVSVQWHRKPFTTFVYVSARCCFSTFTRFWFWHCS